MSEEFASDWKNGSDGGGSWANTVSTVATVVSYISDIASNTLTSTRIGANIGYNYIANNKMLLSTVKYLKPIAYGASTVSIVSDVVLTFEGQQSAVETGFNTSVTMGAVAVWGGSIGWGVAGVYFIGDAAGGLGSFGEIKP